MILDSTGSYEDQVAARVAELESRSVEERQSLKERYYRLLHKIQGSLLPDAESKLEAYKRLKHPE